MPDKERELNQPLRRKEISRTKKKQRKHIYLKHTDKATRNLSPTLLLFDVFHSHYVCSNCFDTTRDQVRKDYKHSHLIQLSKNVDFLELGYQKLVLCENWTNAEGVILLLLLWWSPSLVKLTVPSI